MTVNTQKDEKNLLLANDKRKRTERKYRRNTLIKTWEWEAEGGYKAEMRARVEDVLQIQLTFILFGENFKH